MGRADDDQHATRTKPTARTLAHALGAADTRSATERVPPKSHSEPNDVACDDKIEIGYRRVRVFQE